MNNFNALQSTTVSEAEVADVVPVQAPSFYCSAMQAAIAGNDCMITLLAARPAFRKSTGQSIELAIQQPVGVVYMSMRSLKDLQLIVNDIVSRYEAEWGSIETEFTRVFSGAKG